MPTSWFSPTPTIPKIIVSFIDTDMSPSMSSPSGFPLLSSPLHPRVKKSLRRRPETPLSSKAALITPEKPPPIFKTTMLAAVLFLVLSAITLLNHRGIISSLFPTTTPKTQQQPAEDQTTTCKTHTLPNPLASLFPSNATGVLNATLAIIPIPLSLAHHLIPPGFSILEAAYRSLLPNFPKGMYPVLLQAAYDHDIQLKAYGISIDDFSRIGFEFPFLDLSGDGYSSYRWAPEQLISASNKIAIDGSRAYGTRVSKARFEPGCQAYETLGNGNTWFRGVSIPFKDDDKAGDGNGTRKKLVELEMTRLLSSSSLESSGNPYPYPLDFFRNITNQPTFAKPGGTCDNMIRFFDTAMSRGKFAPASVRGRVKAVNMFPFVKEEELDLDSDSGLSGSGSLDDASLRKREWEWTDVYGVQVATPFIENNYLDCEVMRGYEGWTAPDGIEMDDL